MHANDQPEKVFTRLQLVDGGVCGLMRQARHVILFCLGRMQWVATDREGSPIEFLREQPCWPTPQGALEAFLHTLDPTTRIEVTYKSGAEWLQHADAEAQAAVEAHVATSRLGCAIHEFLLFWVCEWKDGNFLRTPFPFRDLREGMPIVTLTGPSGKANHASTP